MQTISKNNRAHHRARPATHRRQSEKDKTEMRSNCHAGLSYMNYQFSPVWDSSVITCDTRLIENAFYDSLKYFEKLYGCRIARKTGVPFPLNIALDYKAACLKLHKRNPDLSLFISLDTAGHPRLCTAEPYAVDSHTLYYIPIRPLYRLMNDPSAKARADLLLSVFAYLYHVLKIPYYRNENTFLSDCYYRVAEFMTGEDSEDDPETIARNNSLLKECLSEGDAVLKALTEPSHIKAFEERLKTFNAINNSDQELLNIAKQAFDLMHAFPETELTDAIPESIFDRGVDERILAEQYIAFFWDANCEPVYNNLIEYVSGCLENCGAIDSPAGYQLFDQPHEKIQHDSRFASGVFELIINLIEFLIKNYD